MTKPNTVPVVDIEEVTNVAFSMGRNRFDGIDVDEIDSVQDFELGPFRDSAEYANRTLPRLRALAGFGDRTGKGTWTDNRQVVVLDPEDVEDVPAKGKYSESRAILDELIDAWENGAYDAVRDALNQD